MKIKRYLPWWFGIVKRKFPAINTDRVIVAFGDTSYSNAVIMQDKAAHEAIHHDQQHHSNLFAIWWWIKYLNSPDFRFRQEVEAYQAEWKWIQRNNPDKHQNFRYLDAMARDLSSPFYGGLCDYLVAKTIIETPAQQVELIRRDKPFKTHGNF